MADKGPRVRVDMGRGYLINLRQREAEQYVREHPGSQIVGQQPAPISDEAAVERRNTPRRGRSTRAKSEPTGDAGDEGGDE